MFTRSTKLTMVRMIMNGMSRHVTLLMTVASMSCDRSAALRRVYICHHLSPIVKRNGVPIRARANEGTRVGPISRLFGNIESKPELLADQEVALRHYLFSRP